jgi:hypothetical protein
MTIPTPVNGYYVFDLAGISGDKIAVNFKQSAAIRTDGPGKFIIYSAGQALPIQLSDTLANLLAGI